MAVNSANRLDDSRKPCNQQRTRSRVYCKRQGTRSASARRATPSRAALAGWRHTAHCVLRQALEGRHETDAGRINGLGWALVTPAVGVLLLMTIFPALYLLWASFRRFNLMMPDNAAFIGLENYPNIVTNADIRYSMLVTILFVVAAVGIELVLGLLLALMLAPKSRSNAAAATLLILPMAVTPVVSALVWRELFNPNYGWVNYYLRKIGIMGEPIAWLSNPQTSWFTVISLDVWQWTPFVALILMAGLQGIPPEPREAAAVDGAEGGGSSGTSPSPCCVPSWRSPCCCGRSSVQDVRHHPGPHRWRTRYLDRDHQSDDLPHALQDFSVGAAASLGIAFLVFLSILVPQMLRILARNSDLVEA